MNFDRQRGSALMIVLYAIVASAALSAYLYTLTGKNNQNAVAQMKSASSLYNSDGALDLARAQVRKICVSGQKPTNIAHPKQPPNNCRALPPECANLITFKETTPGSNVYGVTACTFDYTLWNDAKSCDLSIRRVDVSDMECRSEDRLFPAAITVCKKAKIDKGATVRSFDSNNPQACELQNGREGNILVVGDDGRLELKGHSQIFGKVTMLGEESLVKGSGSSLFVGDVIASGPKLGRHGHGHGHHKDDDKKDDKDDKDKKDDKDDKDKKDDKDDKDKKDDDDYSSADHDNHHAGKHNHYGSHDHHGHSYSLKLDGYSHVTGDASLTGTLYHKESAPHSFWVRGTLSENEQPTTEAGVCDPLDVSSFINNAKPDGKAGNDFKLNGKSDTVHWQPGIYFVDGFDLKHEQTLYLDGPGAYTLFIDKKKKFKISKSARLIVANGATLTIYLTGDIDISGTGGLINQNSSPKTVTIYSEGKKVKLKKGTSLTALLYAPNAKFELAGSLYGAVRVKEMTFKGNNDNKGNGHENHGHDDDDDDFYNGGDDDDDDMDDDDDDMDDDDDDEDDDNNYDGPAQLCYDKNLTNITVTDKNWRESFN
ncbi:MAG: hypothetical protein HQL72_06790 [Magnetococcales bacterium]|nr:hypothetical protein [Magnetococcales bacterium]